MSATPHPRPVAAATLADAARRFLEHPGPRLLVGQAAALWAWRAKDRRVDPADVAIVALNRGTTARPVRVSLPAELGLSDGTVLRDALGGSPVTVTGGAIEVPFRVRGSSIFIR